jgi:GNAT superfamily N-acetyltransferase
MATYEFVRVDPLEISLFEEVYKQYEQVFPVEERQSYEVLFSRFQQGVNVLFVCKCQQKICAFAFLFLLGKTRFVLLDYFSVLAELRSQGIGSKMLSFLKSELQNQQKIMALEVENPEFGEGREMKEKRIAFYLRNDAALLSNVRFLLPALDLSEKPVEMKLMFLPKFTISKEECAALIHQIHTEVYPKHTTRELINEIILSLPQVITYLELKK